jgi:hypothetical protein
MKLHRSFSENQKEDPFVLDYFNYLGHHEFGLNHKPFLLTDSFNARREKYALDDLNYWVSVWINYYEYLLDSYDPGFLLVSFEDLINEPNRVFDYVQSNLKINSSLKSDKKHSPANYSGLSCAKDLEDRAMSIYAELESRKSY